MVTYSFSTTGKLVIPKWRSDEQDRNVKKYLATVPKISGHSANNIWPQRQNTTQPPSTFEGAGTTLKKL